MAKLWFWPSAGKGRELVEADISGIRADQPTVIFLPGIFTTDKHHDGVAEGLKEIDSLLTRHGEKPPQIIGMSHGGLSNIFNLLAYNGRPGRVFSRAAQEMAAALIMPLVVKDGKPLPEEEAAAKLRNLTFVGYSAGTVFAQEMHNATLKMMVQAGYKAERAQHLLGEIVLISMATVSRPSREPDRFTTLYLAGSNDLAVRLKNRIWRPLSRLFNGRHSEELSIRKLSDRSLLVTAGTGRKLWDRLKSADGGMERREIKPLLPKRLKLRSNHELPHYLTCDDEHNAFSKVVLHGLVNALRRTARLEVGQLLAPIGAHGDMEKEAYGKRIDGGFHRGEVKNKRGKRNDREKSAYPAKFPAAPPHPQP
jgi:hypothetical protein